MGGTEAFIAENRGGIRTQCWRDTNTVADKGVQWEVFPVSLVDSILVPLVLPIIRRLPDFSRGWQFEHVKSAEAFAHLHTTLNKSRDEKLMITVWTLINQPV